MKSWDSNLCLTGVFITIRVLTMCYNLYFILPDLYTMLITCKNMNSNNYWQHTDEPFITNVSYFNALICWVAWLFWICVIYINLIVLVGIAGITLIMSFSKTPEAYLPERVPLYFKVFCAQFCKKFQERISSYVLGTKFDKEFKYNLMKNQELSSSTAFSKHKVIFK